MPYYKKTTAGIEPVDPVEHETDPDEYVGFSYPDPDAPITRRRIKREVEYSYSPNRILVAVILLVVVAAVVSHIFWS